MTVVIKKDPAKEGQSKYASHLGAQSAPLAVTKPSGSVTITGTTLPKNVPASQNPEVAGWMATDGPSAMLKVGGGKTLNLGDFNSVKVYIEVSLPCSPQALNEAYDFGTNWVSEKLEEAEQAIQGMKEA